MSRLSAAKKRRKLRRQIVLGQAEGGRKIILPQSVRQYGMHIIGAPGRGKSKLMEWLIRQDILNGEGLCLLDPHGSLYADIVEWCAATGLLDQRQNILLFEPSSEGWTFGFNPLRLGTENRAQVADAIDAIVKSIAQIWGSEDLSRTPRLYRRLPAVLYAAWAHGMTLPEAVELCRRTSKQTYLTEHVPDPHFRDEWREFNALDRRDFVDTFESSHNRLTPFVKNPLLRLMCSQREVILDFKRVMDEGGVILVNLSGLSEDSKRLIGMLMLNDLYNKGILREPNKSRPFHVYMDEAYYFVNDDLERIAVGLRKFGVWMTLAHHHLSQLEKAGESVYKAVMLLGNRVVFGGLEIEDAEVLASTIFLGELDLENPKEKSARPVVVGHVRTWLENHSRSETHSATSGTSGSESVTESPEGDELSASTSSGWSSSSTASQSWTEGAGQTLEPVLRWLPTQWYSMPEQVYRAMDRLVNNPVQHAIVKLHGKRSERIKTPTVKRTPITGEYVEEAKKRAYGRAHFAQLTERAESEVRAWKEGLEKKSKPQEPDSFLE